MHFSTRLQLLTCLMLYASCAQAIMVKFGTKGGPIEPPPPVSTLPPPQPYRTPAAVWEDRTNDKPDPNAQWRPQLFLPQPRYTQIVFNIPDGTPQSQTSAQRFVNSYLPRQPIQVQAPQNYFTPSQVLSSQSLPGYGLRYFVPTYVNDVENRKQEFRQEDAIQNRIENDDGFARRDSGSDVQLTIEKASSNRNIRHTPEAASPIPYQWPAYIPHRY